MLLYYPQPVEVKVKDMLFTLQALSGSAERLYWICLLEDGVNPNCHNKKELKLILREEKQVTSM